MGCVGEFFAKKPGGSLFGNIVRAAADMFTGGIYSQVNPALPCKSTDQQHYGFGCPGAYHIFKGGLINSFGHGFDQIQLGTNPTANTSTGVSMTVNGFNPTGTIPSTTSNPFNLPDVVIEQIENVVEGLDENIEFDLDDIPASLVNTLDNIFSDGAPPQVLDHLGLNTDFEVVNIPQAVSTWGVNGSIGGVDFSIGDGSNNEQSQSNGKDFEYYWTKVKTWFKSTNGMLITGGVLVSALGYFIYTRYFKKKRRFKRKRRR